MKISGSLSPGERFDRIENALVDVAGALKELQVESALSKSAIERSLIDTDRRSADFMREIADLKRQILETNTRLEKADRRKALVMGLALGSGSLGGGAGAILAKLWGV